MLAVRNLSFAHDARKLLDEASLTVDDGQRAALLGRNGAGKSTLLAILAGELAPDDGVVERGRGQTVGLLAQTPRLDLEARVVDVAVAALKPDDGEHRVEEVLTRLGVVQRAEPVRALSGGGRRRLDVALLLLQRPDVLLLDEPTNHLDAEGIDFLAGELRKHRGVVLFVSHDRAFVDEVATRIVELEDGKLVGYPQPGDGRTSMTDAYLEAKLLRDEHASRTAHRQRRLYVRELAWLRAGTPARTTKQQARIQRAEELADEVEQQTKMLREHRARVEIEAAKARRLGKTILTTKGLVLSRAGRVLVNGLDLALVPGDRWGVVGENGAGKTTLLKAILTAAGAASGDEVKPDAGELVLGKNTKIEVFDQHRTSLDPDATLEEILAGANDHVSVGEKRVHIANYLEQFLFEGEDRYRRVKTLSGGQQNRLVFARLFQQDANLLLLDEPTNDLDVETLGVLEDALLAHDGVAIIVSHDRRFLDRVATGILAFEGEGRVVPVPGDWTNYTRLKAQRAPAAPASAAPASAAPASADSAAAAPTSTGAEPTKRARDKRKRSYKEENEFKGIEKAIEDAEQRRDEIQGALNDGAIFKSDPARAALMAKELADVEPRIEQLYARWQELSELEPM